VRAFFLIQEKCVLMRTFGFDQTQSVWHRVAKALSAQEPQRALIRDKV